jgi:signal transduction histidine kinase
VTAHLQAGEWQAGVAGPDSEDRDGGDRSWRQLDEILSVVSHDLRGPLSALSVAIDAIDDETLDPALRARYLAAMRRAIGRAERFLRDLFDVGRIEAGTLELEQRPIPVAPLVEEAAREHELRARDAGNWIVLEIAEDMRPLMADRDRILQVLEALLSNAIRFARGTGPITLKAEMISAAAGERVRLWVCDVGPGLPRGEVEHIFDRPWRGREERRTGAGLGLYLARGIAEAHGGSVRAVSRPGQGARFCVDLPAA